MKTIKNLKTPLIIKKNDSAKRYEKPVAIKLGSILLIKGNNHFKSDWGAGKAVGLL